MQNNYEQFNLIIRSPVDEIFNGYVQSLLVDTDTGQMEIYPGHATFAGSISYSPLVLYLEDKTLRFHIKRGVIFYSNINNAGSVSAYEAQVEEEVDFASVQEYLDFIETKMKNKENMDSFEYKFLENEKMAIVKKLEHGTE